MANPMITTNKNFYSSVNIAYDLPDDSKVRSFIPTSSACKLVESLFMGAAPGTTSRAKVLVGAYGRGKSHIVLMTLALLSKKEPKLFADFFKDAKALLPGFAKYASDYVKDKTKLLPVVITGNAPDLSQSFLQALLTALKVEGLSELMPQTNMQAAKATIEMWQRDYPDTLYKFEAAVGKSHAEFVAALNSFDMGAYMEFLEAYPALTSGGVFNNLAGLNVIEVYEDVVSGLCKCGFNGIYVVYDEFSKYLETSIADATVSDVKLLQDFAEKCNRSGSEQMHLLLICHKDIANYIDGKLPKEKVDGWRGVSGRFEHLEIRNGFTQSYELIESSILKATPKWEKFLSKNEKALDLLGKTVSSASLVDTESVDMMVKGCYPLHPVTTFLLPRISERVAQNERTLFTYLVSSEKNSFGEAYAELSNDRLAFVTPDSLYDYFEPLFRKEAYASEIHSLYELAARILSRLDGTTLEAKIVKFLMLVYAIAQFECLAPTKEQVISTYSAAAFSPKEVESAIDSLIRKEAVVYLHKSNGYLKLKESSGVDIEREINRDIERNRGRYSLAGILNEIVAGKAFYPSRHNDKNEIVRYFQCSFIDSSKYWDIQENGMRIKNGIDGHVFAVLPFDNEDLKDILDSIQDISKLHSQIVFILPKKLREIEDVAQRYKVALSLRANAGEDALLADDYDVLLEDYSEVISFYTSSYFEPEQKLARYYQGGSEKRIHRKASLSELLSKICDATYPRTPTVNNEAINKNEPSPAAIHSRSKILAGLCAPTLAPGLGLLGNGQECSIMRSVFSVTGIIENVAESPRVNLKPQDENIAYVFTTIRAFIYSEDVEKSLQNLYSELTGSSKGIGLKHGLVILFLAIVLRENWNNLLLLKGRDEQRLSVGALNDIDCYPERYSIQPIEWTSERAEFVEGILSVFADFLPHGHNPSDFTQAVDAISRWYLALPRFTKTATRVYESAFNQDSFTSLPPEYLGMFKALRRPEINPRGFLFDELPALFDVPVANSDLLNRIAQAKGFMDGYISSASQTIADDLREFFDPKAHPDASLSSVIAEWVDGFGDSLSEHVFSGTINRIMSALRSFTSDEDTSLKRLFKAVTSLRIEDWDDRTIQQFTADMGKMKSEVEGFVQNDGSNSNEPSLQISYVNDDGGVEIKSFPATTYSKRAKLLKNEIENALEEMGQSIDESEKRQVLFDVLKGMC